MEDDEDNESEIPKVTDYDKLFNPDSQSPLDTAMRRLLEDLNSGEESYAAHGSTPSEQ